MDPNREKAASDLLQDAIEKFDIIIEESAQMDVADLYKNGGIIDGGYQGLGQILDDLKMTIEAEQISSEDTVKLLGLLSPDTLQFYRDLFRVQETSDEGKYEPKLQSEKESLTLQVSVLSDQVELQMEKIEELLETIKDLQNKLLSTGESLQQEILARTKHESHALALMEELSEMKIELAQREHSRKMSKEATSQNENVTRLPTGMNVSGIESHLDQDATSPDEGIVNDDGDDAQEKQPLHLRMPEPSATSTPIGAGTGNAMSSKTHDARMENKIPGVRLDDPITNSPTSRPGILKDSVRSMSLERLHAQRLLPAMQTDDLQKSSSQNENLNCTDQAEASPKKLTSEANAKSSSSPNLAITEVVKDNGAEDEISGNDNSAYPSNFQSRKKHGFKKLFTSFRLRRSHSSSFQDSSSSPTWKDKHGKQQKGSQAATTSTEHFQRGRFRATAGPRVGWNRPQKQAVGNASPFGQWGVDEVCDWFIELGLVQYVDSCKSWVKNGATLLSATNQDIEKELGIRNPLHKKKLLLSLQALGEEGEVDGLMVKGSGMDLIWVSRWLDDIGLPQYKDSFHEACIDGRMLHHLTIGDLQRLRVTNVFHTLSLRRAIYTLRRINFDPTRLKRRPVDQSMDKEDVTLWTNHRVMEWLRSIDLAEYAPNLRGSGVHGSLIVLEPQFTGDILASLLHIPNSKSLLRRHLCAKFNDIIPPEHRRKEGEVSTLSITAKVKVGKRSFGPLARLRGATGGSSQREFSSGEYVCPIETKNSGVNRSLGTHRRNLEARLQVQDARDKKNWNIADEKDLDDDGSSTSGDIKVVELNENTTRKIEAFSAELATMTNKWSED